MNRLPTPQKENKTGSNHFPYICNVNKNEELQYSDPDNDENVKLEDRVQIRPFCISTIIIIFNYNYYY